MFLYIKNTKEACVTIGVTVSFFVFWILSVKFAHKGGYWLILCLTSFVPIPIYLGMKFGYWIGKFIIGAAAILLIAGALSPFMYESFDLGDKFYVLYLFKSMIYEAILLFSFYALGAHAKMRHSK